MSHHFRDLLRSRDRVRYLAWQLTGRRTEFRCKLQNGLQLSMRGRPSNDFMSAYEVFKMEVYQTGLTPSEVLRVVDLGGNVGYSCLYFCRKYPNARVLTFEPHPRHAELLDHNVELNGYSERVTLIRAAASTRSGKVNLTDANLSSAVVGASVTEKPGLRIFAVDAVDMFPVIGRDPIDILKMDIEGSEYELMQDPRFEELSRQTRCIVMEWHNWDTTHLGHDWCVSRLRSLDFQIELDLRSSANLGTILAKTSSQGPATPGKPSLSHSQPR